MALEYKPEVSPTEWLWLSPADSSFDSKPEAFMIIDYNYCESEAISWDFF